ncbi:hypothetical protein B0T18DRAFT_489027 [Schizothecium vesticola]|uniref:Ubiquitin conjugation factor E4 core domain-containing protein n=1 Tax=Schizothecium vesticola TaxID=314040 RepID=A0AA40EWA7_9PEZI|nr:hypothetical protein B0T18DRAFT_489027 [Schizothecium vesticola]
MTNTKPANDHLIHAVMKFYIECESTGASSQLYDKLNIRYEIFQVIKAVWTNDHCTAASRGSCRLALSNPNLRRSPHRSPNLGGSLYPPVILADDLLLTSFRNKYYRSEGAPPTSTQQFSPAPRLGTKVVAVTGFLPGMVWTQAEESAPTTSGPVIAYWDVEARLRSPDGKTTVYPITGWLKEMVGSNQHYTSDEVLALMFRIRVELLTGLRQSMPDIEVLPTYRGDDTPTASKKPKTAAKTSAAMKPAASHSQTKSLNGSATAKRTPPPYMAKTTYTSSLCYWSGSSIPDQHLLPGLLSYWGGVLLDAEIRTMVQQLWLPAPRLFWLVLSLAHFWPPGFDHGLRTDHGFHLPRQAAVWPWFEGEYQAEYSPLIGRISAIAAAEGRRDLEVRLVFDVNHDGDYWFNHGLYRRYTNTCSSCHKPNELMPAGAATQRLFHDLIQDDIITDTNDLEPR